MYEILSFYGKCYYSMYIRHVSFCGWDSCLNFMYLVLSISKEFTKSKSNWSFLWFVRNFFFYLPLPIFVGEIITAMGKIFPHWTRPFGSVSCLHVNGTHPCILSPAISASALAMASQKAAGKNWRRKTLVAFLFFFFPLLFLLWHSLCVRERVDQAKSKGEWIEPFEKRCGKWWKTSGKTSNWPAPERHWSAIGAAMEKPFPLPSDICCHYV